MAETHFANDTWDERKYHERWKVHMHELIEAVNTPLLTPSWLRQYIAEYKARTGDYGKQRVFCNACAEKRRIASVIDEFRGF